MTKDTVTTLEQAIEATSESIANLVRFVEALNKFLVTNDLGSADYSPHKPEISENGHGYEIAIFHLVDRQDKDVIYFYVYTDGTVWGENFSDEDSSDVNDGCTYIEAVREVLKTVGVMSHSRLLRRKIDGAIKALGN